MAIKVRSEGEVRILELAGEFALGSRGLGHALDLRGNRLQDLSTTLLGQLEEGHSRIVLDLSQVPFLDSAGLGELVACKKRARAKGGDVRLLNPTRRVRELFEITELTRVFEIFDDEREALASFRAAEEPIRGIGAEPHGPPPPRMRGATSESSGSI